MCWAVQRARPFDVPLTGAPPSSSHHRLLSHAAPAPLTQTTQSTTAPPDRRLGRRQVVPAAALRGEFSETIHVARARREPNESQRLRAAPTPLKRNSRALSSLKLPPPRPFHTQTRAGRHLHRELHQHHRRGLCESLGARADPFSPSSASARRGVGGRLFPSTDAALSRSHALVPPRPARTNEQFPENSDRRARRQGHQAPDREFCTEG